MTSVEFFLLSFEFLQCNLIACNFKKFLRNFSHSTSECHAPWIHRKQDSPAWTQEAYRPPLIKYSMGCPVPGGGGGTPGGHPPSWGTSSCCPDLARRGGTPGGCLPWLGYPPPHLDLARVPSLPHVWTARHLWKQYLTVVLRTRSAKIGLVLSIFYKLFFLTVSIL